MKIERRGFLAGLLGLPFLRWLRPEPVDPEPAPGTFAAMVSERWDRNVAEQFNAQPFPWKHPPAYIADFQSIDFEPGHAQPDGRQFYYATLNGHRIRFDDEWNS